MSDEPLIVGPESAVAPALLRREPDHVRHIDWTYAGGIAALASCSCRSACTRSARSASISVSIAC
jgi:hypothetical protein